MIFPSPHLVPVKAKGNSLLVEEGVAKDGTNLAQFYNIYTLLSGMIYGSITVSLDGQAAPQKNR